MLEVIAWMFGAYIFIACCIGVTIMWLDLPDSKLKIAAGWLPFAALKVWDWWKHR